MNKLSALRLLGAAKNKVLTGPEIIHFEIINACNLKCIFCWYHTPSKKDISRSLSKRRMMSYLLFKRTIDECQKLKVARVKVSAQGEPSLHPYFREMIVYLKDKDLYVTLFSNGTFEQDVARQLNNINEIWIDLSAATPELYKTIQSQNKNDLFDNVIENLDYFRTLKAKHLKCPQIKINFILNNKNYHELPLIFNLARRYKIDYLNIPNVNVYEDTREFGINRKEMLKKINGIFNKLAADNTLFRIKSNVSVNYHLHHRFLNRQAPLKPKACYSGYFFALVNMNGDVTPCCNIKNELIAGNLNKASLEEIWFSRRFNKIRDAGEYTLYNDEQETCRQCCFAEFNNRVHSQIHCLRK